MYSIYDVPSSKKRKYGIFSPNQDSRFFFNIMITYID